MLCSEFDARMQSLLDHRKPPELDPAILSHVQNCTSCNAQLATLSSVLDALDVMEVPDLAPDFAHSVVQSLASSSLAPSPTRSRSTWLLVAAAIAAILLLAALPLSWYAVRGGREVARPTTRPQPFAGPSAANSARQVPPSTDALEESWLVPVSILELYPAETRERHRQQVTQIADDLRPIATPFNAAVTAIRRSIPVGRSGVKGEPRASLQRPSRTRDLS